MRQPFHICKMACRRLLLLAFQLLGGICLFAQDPVKNYTVKDGTMYIELSKHLSKSSLDSFVLQFDLNDLALQEFIQRNLHDSLIKHGWKIEKNTNTYFIISKPLLGFDRIKNPAEKILFTEKHFSGGKLFPGVISSDAMGFNRFKDKKAFAIKDSIVTFFLRNNQRASRVILSGSFNDWSTDNLPMQKVDSGWIKEIKLAPGKYWYKFIVDGNWTTDKDNRLNENDGEGNINSVYYKPNFTIRLDSFSNARKVVVAGSFNNWDPRELTMEKRSMAGDCRSFSMKVRIPIALW